MDLGLRGKRAVVIGASRGIGRAIANCLGEEGCDVAICARREEGVTETVAALSGKGVRASGEAVDVTDSASAVEWLQRVAKEFEGIDIFVWNVSAQSRDWGAMYNTDIAACVHVVESVVPYLKASKHGSIIGIASQAASLAAPGYKAYSAMKAAFVSYLASLARELAPSGIRVNAVSPSEIYSEDGIWERIRRERPERYEEALKKTPMGRLGTPEEVARVVAFVCSPAASLMSGSNILVDGMSREFVQL
jgi:3-oxoacyl-[acyl-carrier protein] reductase